MRRWIRRWPRRIHKLRVATASSWPTPSCRGQSRCGVHVQSRLPHPKRRRLHLRSAFLRLAAAAPACWATGHPQRRALPTATPRIARRWSALPRFPPAVPSWSSTRSPKRCGWACPKDPARRIRPLASARPHNKEQALPSSGLRHSPCPQRPLATPWRLSGSSQPHSHPPMEWSSLQCRLLSHLPHVLPAKRRQKRRRQSRSTPAHSP